MSLDTRCPHMRENQFHAGINRCPVDLVFEATVAQLAQSVEEHGTAKGVAGLTFVQPGGAESGRSRRSNRA
jgi:hypothetical protein